MLRHSSVLFGLALILAACNQSSGPPKPVLDARTGEAVPREELIRISSRLATRFVDYLDCSFSNSLKQAITTDTSGDAIADRVHAQCRSKQVAMFAVLREAKWAAVPKDATWLNPDRRIIDADSIASLRARRSGLIVDYGSTPAQRAAFEATKAAIFCSLKPITADILEEKLIGTGRELNVSVDAAIEACQGSWDKASALVSALPAYSRSQDLALVSSRSGIAQGLNALGAAIRKGILKN